MILYIYLGKLTFILQYNPDIVLTKKLDINFKNNFNIKNYIYYLKYFVNYHICC